MKIPIVNPQWDYTEAHWVFEQTKNRLLKSGWLELPFNPINQFQLLSAKYNLNN